MSLEAEIENLRRLLQAQQMEKVKAQAERDALRAELAAEREALEPFAKLNVSRFMTDGIKYVFRIDAKDVRRARARIDAALAKGDK